jgi:group II intron reverse transcriptase/maturase
VLGSLKAIGNIMSTYSISLAKDRSIEENKIVQTAKGVTPDITMNIKEKKHNKEIGDLTAELSSESNSKTKKIMRGRKDQGSKINKKDPKNDKGKKDKNKRKDIINKVNNIKEPGKIVNLVKDLKFSSPIFTEKISKSSFSEEELCRVIGNELDKFKDLNGKYNGIIRIIANPLFLLECYKIIKSKPGNLSPGTIPETLDGIDEVWFKKTADELLIGRYQFKPARQVLIPKKVANTFRPINISSPREKIVQKALQLLLTSIFEKIFLPCSHGFRPNKSTHSALDILHFKGGPYVWVIQGDIEKCFDSMPHVIIMKHLKTHISCVRTLTFIERILKAGYIQADNRKIIGKIGTPQGSIISPLLANVVLNELDKFIEEDLSKLYNIGTTRKRNKEYERWANYRRKSRIDKVTPEKRALALKMMRSMPKLDVYDPNYKRMLYLRYADDFVILIIGTMGDANEIRSKVKEFLKDKCGLTLNIDKTEITSLRKGFHFLGAYCFKEDNKSIFNRSKNQLKVQITRRSTLRLRVDLPLKELVLKLIKFGFARRNKLGKVYAKGITHMIHQDHFTIVRFFNAKIGGILNYYSFAGNRALLHRLFWILRQSCALTLARKFKLKTMRKAFKKFGYELKDPETDVSLNIPKSLKRISEFKIKNSPRVEDLDEVLSKSWANKLTLSIKFGVCSLCGSSTKVEMHHVRKVNDVRQKMRTGNMTFGEWQGSVLRKQIPLSPWIISQRITQFCRS